MSLDAQRSWECFCCCGRRAPPAAVSESCRVTYGVLAFCDSWKISRSKKDANHQIGEITLSESKHDAASRSLDYVLTVLEELTILTYFFTFLLAQHCSWPMVQDARSKAWKQYESNLVGVSTLSWTPSRSLGKKTQILYQIYALHFSDIPTFSTYEPQNPSRTSWRGQDCRWVSMSPISSFSISSVDPFWMNRSLEFRRGKWWRVAAWDVLSSSAWRNHEVLRSHFCFLMACDFLSLSLHVQYVYYIYSI